MQKATKKLRAIISNTVRSLMHGIDTTQTRPNLECIRINAKKGIAYSTDGHQVGFIANDDLKKCTDCSIKLSPKSPVKHLPAHFEIENTDIDNVCMDSMKLETATLSSSVYPEVESVIPHQCAYAHTVVLDYSVLSKLLKSLSLDKKNTSIAFTFDVSNPLRPVIVGGTSDEHKDRVGMIMPMKNDGSKVRDRLYNMMGMAIPQNSHELKKFDVTD